MIVAIDGTGEADDRAYALDMANSYCNQIARSVSGTYLRGPTVLGSETQSICSTAVGAALRLGSAGAPIRLAGFSRGGCIAILAAKHLAARGLRVQSLFLFDPVDMQLSDASSSQIITDNVDYVARVRTARDIGYWLTTSPSKSRLYFWNTGRWLAGRGKFDHETFTGSHGAMGGCPWPDLPGDLGAAAAVAGWMTPRLRAQGLNVSLNAVNRPPAP